VRPGDLTGRTFAQNQARIEAEKRVRENPPVDIEAIRASAYKAGYETGYSKGIAWVNEMYDVYEKEDDPNEE
jgi:hypothetical protein